jgi:hypothetical protein
MKKSFFFLLASLLLTGCAHPTWQPYVGKQKDWPIASGAFTTSGTVIPVYESVPPTNYIVVGRLSLWTQDICVNLRCRAACEAKKHGADAIFVDNKRAFEAANFPLNSQTNSVNNSGGVAVYSTGGLFPAISYELSVVAIKWKTP